MISQMRSADNSESHEPEDDQPQPRSRDDQASHFARIVSTRWPTIKFIGVWDTVASVTVPRPDRFYTFSLQELAFTRANP
jgi:T6SS, Phospholipase effector Tle1-like, catalytic domain